MLLRVFDRLLGAGGFLCPRNRAANRSLTAEECRTRRQLTRIQPPRLAATGLRQVHALTARDRIPQHMKEARTAVAGRTRGIAQPSTGATGPRRGRSAPRWPPARGTRREHRGESPHWQNCADADKGSGRRVCDVMVPVEAAVRARSGASSRQGGRPDVEEIAATGHQSLARVMAGRCRPERTPALPG